MDIVAGTHATLIYPQDSYPMVVSRVSESGKTVWLRSLLPVSKDTGHAPAHFNGPWPVWDHTYTEDEVQDLVIEHALERRASLRKDGTWKISGATSTVMMGTARYYRDYSY